MMKAFKSMLIHLNWKFARIKDNSATFFVPIHELLGKVGKVQKRLSTVKITT